MEATELRIGNFITDKWATYGGFFNVVTVSGEYCIIKYGVRLSANIENCRPILLTEEWLYKFGFEKTTTSDYFNAIHTDGYWFSKNDFDVTLFNGEFNYSYKVYDGGSSEMWNYCTEIKYVHQLQNLYFALTGEELTIK